MCESLKTSICQRCQGTGEINMNTNWESCDPFSMCPDCLGTGIIQADLFDTVNVRLGDGGAGA